MPADMPAAGRQLTYVGIRAGCEPASSTVSGGTGVRSSALHTRAGRAGREGAVVVQLRDDLRPAISGRF